MKRSRHFGPAVTTAIIAALTMGAISGGTPAVAVESGLSERFSANLYGDVITVGNSLPACDRARSCPHASSAMMSPPAGASIAHARLQWASGLGGECAASEPVTEPRLRQGDTTSTLSGTVTGENTAEAEVTELLRLPPDGTATTVTAHGIRADTCAAGWSLTVAYQVPRDEAADVGMRHISIHSGASTSPEPGLTMDGFRHHGTNRPHLTATVYGDARLRVNDTEVTTKPTSHVRGAWLPAGTIAEGDTSASMGFGGGGLLVQQVALSVPVPDLNLSATAVPREIGPGDTVVHTVTAKNNGDGGIQDASIRIDLSEALDDATRPFRVTASRGEVVLAGTSLKWNGTVPAGDEVTLTYSMTIKNPRPGDGRLESTVIGGTGTNCAPGSAAPECQVRLRFPPRPDAGTADSSPTRRLPVTGASPSAVTAVAITSIVAGAALLLASRRRGR